MSTNQKQPLRVAYFTMEIGLESSIPTYAGGLGMLAADIMRSCADLKISAACMTICWQFGYLKQKLNADGTQLYEDVHWKPQDLLKKLDMQVSIRLEGREVKIAVWLYELKSGKHTVPVYFLDTDVEANDQADRDICKHLYGGDGSARIKQETVLGFGGVKMLRALGYEQIANFHMNEGHAAFLTLELLKERNFVDAEVKKSCAFTTHTPEQAGHDRFSYDFAGRILGDHLPWHIKKLAGENELSMTHLAMHLSRYTCGVSKVHAVVSNRLFPGETIDYITNGVHLQTWTSEAMQSLLDTHIPGWREHHALLPEHCRDIPDEDLWRAHMQGKKRLLKHVEAVSGITLDANVLTIASARRIVSYKRPELLYTNLKRLQEIASGKVQIIHAGNAHPDDRFGQEVIQRIIQRSRELKDCINIVYLPNYNPDLAKLLTAGSDVWLNTPMRLHEASGTSGMKACINGTLNVSTLDGWWIEAYAMDPEAGWRIGPLAEALNPDDTRQIDAEDLYTQLQYQVIPEYYREDRKRWIRRMKRSIGLMGYFNTDRCVREYLEKAWREYGM